MTYHNQSTSLSRTQFSAWFSAFVGWVFDYYEVFLLTFLLVPVSQEFGLSTGESAYLVSIALLFLAVGGVLFGFLADRFGRQRMLMWTIVIYAVFTFARAFSPDYGWLLALTAIAALGIGGEYGVGQTLVSEVMPRNRRGWWSGLLYSGIYIGIMMAALAGGYLVPAVGWRWTFAISGLPILIAVFVRYAAPESDVWEAKRRTTGIDWSYLRRRAFIIPFLVCVVAGVFQFFAYYGLTSFLPTYLVQNEGFSASQAGWWVFFTGFAGLVGGVTAAFLNDRWGRRPTLSFIAGSAAVGGVILAFTIQFVSTSLWVLVPFFIVYFGSNGAAVFGALFSEQFPTDVRSTGVSSALQIARGLAFFPPLIVAAIFPIFGFRAIVLGAAGLFALLALWAWVFKDLSQRDIFEADAESGVSSGVPYASSGDGLPGGSESATEGERPRA